MRMISMILLPVATHGHDASYIKKERERGGKQQLTWNLVDLKYENAILYKMDGNYES
jgi:hypothetical protein